MNQLVYLAAIVFKPNIKGITYKLHNRFGKQFNLITSWIRRDKSSVESMRELLVSHGAGAGEEPAPAQHHTPDSRLESPGRAFISHTR